MRHCGTHSSMLRRNGFHMSTQHASTCWRRHRLNCVRKLVQRLLLPVSAKPQWLAGLQIAHYREKLVALSPVNLIHAHLSQRWLASLRVPSLQTAQIDGTHRTLDQSESPGHLPRRCALARLRHRLLKTLTEGRFTRKQRNSLHLHSAVRTFHPVDLDVYRGSEFAPGQIPHRSFTAVVYLGELSAANRTFQLAVPAFAVHPQIQGLSLLIDFLPVYPVTGPLQDAGELVVCRQPPNLPQSPTSSKARQSARTTDSRSAPKL